MIHTPDAALIQLHRRLGDAKLKRLLEQFSIGESTSALAELQQRHGITGSKSAAELSALLAKQGAGLMTLLDREYPVWLRALGADAPPFLYFLGCPQRLLANSIAIIGMRRPTAAGRMAARIVAESAASGGWIIASGNAPGIDCAGHTAALSVEGGATLVFPPGPLDKYQPLFKNNCPDRVTVASPFVPGSEIAPWMFLRRNTLVAGQCRAAFVAETGVRGGTLDTVKKLNKMKRPTFATLLPSDAAHGKSHQMLAAGGIELVDVLNTGTEAAESILFAAANAPVTTGIKTAVLNDFFEMEGLA